MVPLSTWLSLKGTRIYCTNMLGSFHEILLEFAAHNLFELYMEKAHIGTGPSEHFCYSSSCHQVTANHLPAKLFRLCNDIIEAFYLFLFCPYSFTDINLLRKYCISWVNSKERKAFTMGSSEHFLSMGDITIVLIVDYHSVVVSRSNAKHLCLLCRCEPWSSQYRKSFSPVIPRNKRRTNNKEVEDTEQQRENREGNSMVFTLECIWALHHFGFTVKNCSFRSRGFPRRISRTRWKNF